MRVVLVSPQGPLNVGAVARAMKNMGVDDLALVNPFHPPLHPHALLMAQRAKEILERAQVFSSLQEALSPCTLVVGTTRRRGKRRGRMLSPREIAPEIVQASREGKVALVFGPERMGLSNEEIDLCQELVMIPAEEGYGSLNLAQAVMVLLYEVFLAREGMAGERKQRPRSLPSWEELEGMYRHMERVLLQIGFLEGDNPSRMMTALRRIFGRARLDPREVRIIRGIFHQVEWAIGRRGRGD